MKHDPHTPSIDFIDPEICMELNAFPRMGFVFLKALWLGMRRSNFIDPNTRVPRTRICIKNITLDPKKIADYRQVCGFSGNPSDSAPISCFQSLFVSLLGKFITSDGFPINPLGLIHIFQSLELKRPVSIDESLDLSCTLDDMAQTPKGIESKFILQVKIKDELVWQGMSIFLTKKQIVEKKKAKKQDSVFLDKKDTIAVPAGTGRKYAAVSGDYNPHHLFTLLAKCFGFKQAIAHGMWSLARTLASLDQAFAIQNSPLYVETFFKRPIFMPATLALGYEKKPNGNKGLLNVNFELRDDASGIPHLKGRLSKPEQAT